MTKAALIGVDWGTSSLRAFRIDAGGAALDRRESPQGILKVADGAFAAALLEAIGDWLEPGSVVLASGMIGSRQGWVEAPYLSTPAGLDDLAAALAQAPFAETTVHFVPGVTTKSGMHDVMRGEEAQIFGATALLGVERARFVLPGTHSKWVEVADGRIVTFATYMTGEIYAAARHHTILGRLMTGEADDKAAFLRGVRDGASEGGPGALLHRLFGVRTAGLFDEVAAAGLPNYLSGLLIGAELADQAGGGDEVVHIIASDALAARYRVAATALSVATQIVPSDCIAGAYMAIARRAGLLGAGLEPV